MVRHIAIFTVALLLSVCSIFGQTPESDSQVLHSILLEIRGMRNDVRLTATSQILLTELQTQQAFFNQAMLRVNNFRLQLSDLRTAEKGIADRIARAPDRLRETADPVEKKEISEKVSELTSDLAGMKSTEETLSNNVQDAEQQLRSAQYTLDGIQKDLSSAIGRLQPAADHP